MLESGTMLWRYGLRGLLSVNFINQKTSQARFDRTLQKSWIYLFTFTKKLFITAAIFNGFNILSTKNILP